MSARRTSRRLRDALPETPLMAPELGLGWLVTALDTGVTPWRVQLRGPDGSTTGWVVCAGWYAPTVNDVVMIARVQGALVCLGAFAGAAHVIATTATLTGIPAPAAPPPAPDPAPTLRVEVVDPVASATSTPDSGSWPSGWRTDTDDLRQGGTVAQRGWWFYGTRIADAVGSGTLLAATVEGRRADWWHGPSGPATLRIGAHPYQTQAAAGAGSAALTSVQVAASAAVRGQSWRVTLSADLVAALDGGARGVGLEPGSLGAEDPATIVVDGVASWAARGDAGDAVSGRLQLTVSD